MGEPTILYGRERELERVETSLGRVAEGRGDCLLITGPLGVGAASLTDAACIMAKERGMTALRGRAWPLSGGLAYGPILEAIGPMLRRADLAHRTALTSGLDDLGRLFPWLDARPDLAHDPAMGRSRLFEAIAALIDRLTRSAPVLLCIDDLHAADEATVELLQYLVHATPSTPLVLLLTVRSTAASQQLRLMMTLLEQAELASTLTLEPLDRAQTRALIEAQLGATASDDLVTLVDERARGLPLFINATLMGLRSSEGLLRVDDTAYPAKGAEAKLPEGLRPLIDASLASLTPRARGVVDILSLVDESLDYRVLRGVGELEEDELLDVLSSLKARGLVVERTGDGAPTYHIAQPLAQEAVHDGLPEAARRKLHQRLIRGLEASDEADVVQLARHYRALGTSAPDPVRSIEVLSEAAAAATTRLGHRECAHWLSAAATVLRSVGPDARLIEVLGRLGHAWRSAGEASTAVEVWREALSLSTARRDERTDDLWSRAALAAWDAGRYAECDALLRRGSDALEPGGPSRPLAGLYLAMLTIRARQGSNEDVERIAERLAQPGFRELSPESEFQIRLALFHAEEIRGNDDAAMAALRYAARVAHEPEQRFRVQFLSAGGALYSGKHHDVAQVLTALEELIADDRLDQHRPVLQMYRGMVAQMQGRWDDALVALHDALATGIRLGVSRWRPASYAARAILLARRGDLPAAEDDLQRAAASMGRVPERFASVVPIARAVLCLEQSDDAAAADSVSGLAPVRIYPEWDSIRVEALVRGGRAPDLEPAASTGSPFAGAFRHRVHGIAAAGHGDAAAAHVAFTQAIDAFEALQIPFEAARARLERAALRRDDDGVCIQDAKQSADTFNALGAQRYHERSRALLKALGVKPATRRRTRASDELSDRELEVARLAASGLTNAEVAKELFLSPHTVATHIKRIYMRLDVSSRRALGKRLAELRLLDDGQAPGSARS